MITVLSSRYNFTVISGRDTEKRVKFAASPERRCNKTQRITTWFYFNKITYGGSEKSKIPTFIIGLNPSVRFIFLPLSLKGRTMAVDMTNYKEVQRVFGLKD